MQYTHRKLHLSVTDIRRSRSGRAKVSLTSPIQESMRPPDRSGGLITWSLSRSGPRDSDRGRDPGLAVRRVARVTERLQHREPDRVVAVRDGRDLVAALGLTVP